MLDIEELRLLRKHLQVEELLRYGHLKGFSNGKMQFFLVFWGILIKMLCVGFDQYENRYGSFKVCLFEKSLFLFF